MVVLIYGLLLTARGMFRFQAFGHDPSLTDPAGVDLGFAPDEWQI
jgi:hypothetical protein